MAVARYFLSSIHAHARTEREGEQATSFNHRRRRYILIHPTPSLSLPSAPSRHQQQQVQERGKGRTYSRWTAVESRLLCLCLPPYASGFRPRRRDSYPLHPLSPAFVMLCVCGRWSFPTGYSKRPAVKSFSGVVRLGR